MYKILTFLLFVPLIAFFGCSSSRSAQTSTPPAGERKEGMKPYSEVITKDEKSDTGVFIVHHIKQKFLYEIPRKEFGKEFLLVTTQSKTQTGIGYGGDY